MRGNHGYRRHQEQNRMEYSPMSEILAKIKGLEAEIQKVLAELEEMLNG